jgi:O-antigen/teichoic acid export membrane protein
MLKLSDLTKNTLTLVIGAITAQVIPFALQPFLRRIYSVEDFGSMTIFLNLFAVLSIISALRYEAAIVLPKKNNESANIVSLTFLLNFLYSLILLVCLLLFKNTIAVFLNFPAKYINFLFFLPAGIFMFGICQSINYWLIRQKAFISSSGNKIVRRLAEGVTQTVLGIFKIPGGLFIGDLLGHFANTIAGLRQLFRNQFSFKNVSQRKMAFVQKKYIVYPKYNAIPTLLSSAANALPFLFINKIYSTEVVGYLDLSKLVLSIPLIFISSALSQVLFQQITFKKHERLSVKKDIITILYAILAIVVIEIIVVMFFAPNIFAVVFGSQYKLSGNFSQILVFSFVFNFIGSAFSSVFMTFEKIKINSIWQIVYFSAICLLCFFNNLSIHTFLMLFVTIEVIMHFSYCVLIWRILNDYEKGLNRV